MPYSGFLSYSHAADGNLAPAVQSALHRFARPWYRVRSVWIFRDKTGLAVTPSLWDTIQKALADSEYFLLMASPEASDSPWVRKEVDWWLANRSASNILLLLTDGEIAWNSGASDFDWSRTTALPPTLRERMAQEPLWVDLRWARTEEKLSLRHSRFRAAILDIASTLLNRPKESLDSEDVRVYKRNRLAASAAVIVSLLLAVGATIEAVSSRRNASEAQHQRSVAETNAAEARRQKKAAEDNAAEATRQRNSAVKNENEARRQAEIALANEAQAKRQQAIAEENGRIAERNARQARARELTVYANESLKEDPERSVMLAAEAVRATLDHGEAPLAEAESALHQALYSSRLSAVLRHGGPVRAVAWSPDGKWLATAGNDGVLKIWDAATREPVAGTAPQKAPMVSLAFSPDGKRLASGGQDGVTKLWDAASGQELLALRFEPDIAFDRRLSTLNYKIGANAVAFSPDGKRLIVASENSSVARVCDSADGHLIMALRGHTGAVTAVAWSPDGKLLATVGAERTSWESKAKVWNAETGQEVGTLTNQAGFTATAAFSPDSKTLATTSADRSATIWDTATLLMLQTLRGHTNFLSAALFSPRGDLMATASLDGTVRMWMPSAGVEGMILRGHRNCIEDAAFSPDGRQLVTGGLDGEARIWSLDRGEEEAGWDVPLGPAAFSPDGARFAAGAGNVAAIRDSRSGAVLARLEGHLGRIMDVAFDPNGRRVATMGEDRTVRIWDAAVGKQLVVIQAARYLLQSMAWSPDGKQLAVSAGTGAKIWNAEDGSEVAALTSSGGSCSELVFSPDGKRLAGTAGPRMAAVWDAATGKELFAMRDHPTLVTAVAYSPDGSRIATGSRDVVTIRDARDGHTIQTLHLQPYVSGLVTQIASVKGLAFSPDGWRVAVTGWGSTVRVWKLASEQEMTELRGGEPAAGRVAFSRDGGYVFANGQGRPQMFAVGAHELLRLAESRISRRPAAFTAEECARYFQSGGCPGAGEAAGSKLSGRTARGTPPGFNHLQSGP